MSNNFAESSEQFPFAKFRVLTVIVWVSSNGRRGLLAAVWLRVKVRERGLELRLRLNDGPVCDAQLRWGGIQGCICQISTGGVDSLGEAKSRQQMTANFHHQPFMSHSLRIPILALAAGGVGILTRGVEPPRPPRQIQPWWYMLLAALYRWTLPLLFNGMMVC